MTKCKIIRFKLKDGELNYQEVEDEINKLLSENWRLIFGNEFFVVMYYGFI